MKTYFVSWKAFDKEKVYVSEGYEFIQLDLTEFSTIEVYLKELLKRVALSYTSTKSIILNAFNPI